MSRRTNDRGNTRAVPPGEPHDTPKPLDWRRLSIRTGVAGSIFFAYALGGPHDSRTALLGYAAAATVLVAVVLFAHGALARRLGARHALAAVSVAVFISGFVAAQFADPCPVGGSGRCTIAGGAATGFSAMLLPIVVFVTYTLGAWTVRMVGTVAILAARAVRRLWAGARRPETTARVPSGRTRTRGRSGRRAR